MDPKPNQQNYQPQQLEQKYEMDIDDNYYNYEDQDYMQQLTQLTQNKSNDPSANLQYQMKDLIRRIYKQINNINQITNLGFDGTLLLYYLSSWNSQLCNTFIIQDSNQIWQIRKLNNLGFKQGRVSQKGMCNVCFCMSSKLVRNICGHLFCEQDWIQHMFYRLTYNSQDPFPKCMEQGCQARISYTICQILSQHNNNLKQKVIQVMCRSYAINNRSVKMCKGRPGFNCTRCFTVEKMLSIIECEACGNLVCPRCGQISHGPSECKNLSKWAVIKQNTMGLTQYYQFQTCPHCKNGVQRISGCNQIICRCKATFCFICGQKWLPDHPTLENGADYCPNYKELVKKYKQRKLRRKQNIIFCQRIQGKRQQLVTLEQMLEQVEGLKLKLSTIIKQLMKQYPFHESQLRKLYSDSIFIKKTICLLWGEALSEYFISNQRSKFFCERIRVSLKKVYSFLFEFILGMYNILANPKEQTTEQENEYIMKAKKQFYKQYFQLQKILAQDKDNIRKITRQEYDYLVFE